MQEEDEEIEVEMVAEHVVEDFPPPALDVENLYMPRCVYDLGESSKLIEKKCQLHQFVPQLIAADAQQPRYLSKLPRELLILILAELDLANLLLARLVCKTFEHLISRSNIPLNIALSPGSTDRTAQFLWLLFPSVVTFLPNPLGFRFTLSVWKEIHKRGIKMDFVHFTADANQIDSFERSKRQNILEREINTIFSNRKLSHFYMEMLLALLAVSERKAVFLTEAADLYLVDPFRNASAALSLCEEALRSSVILNPLHTRVVRAKALHQLGQKEKALSQYNEIVTMFPRLPEAFLERGRYFCFHAKEPAKAMLDFQSAIELNPSRSWEVHNLLGLACTHTDQFAAAIEHYTAALTANPEFPDPLWNRADAHINLFQYEPALADLQRCVAIAPDEPGHHKGLGDLLLNIGRFEDALRSFERALAMEPKAIYYRCRAKAYRKLMRYEEALVDFTTSIRIAPQEKIAYSGRAITYLQLNRAQDALEDLRISMNSHLPTHCSLHYFFSKCYEMLKEPEKATQSLKQILSFRLPKNGNWDWDYSSMGYAMMKLGSDRTEALENLNRAILMSPSTWEHRLHRAVCLSEMNRVSEAREDLRTALSFTPKPPQEIVDLLAKLDGGETKSSPKRKNV